MDVRVKNKKTGEVQEMSEYMFSLLRSDFDLAGNEANKRPVIEMPVVEKIEEPKTIQYLPIENQETTQAEKDSILTGDQVSGLMTLSEQYEKLFGKKPHGRMKEESILAAIKEKQGPQAGE